MDSRDAKIAVIFIIWTITGVISWLVADMDGVVLCHVFWFVLLFVLINWPPFRKWFYKR